MQDRLSELCERAAGRRQPLFSRFLNLSEQKEAEIAARKAQAHTLIAELYNDRAARDHRRARQHVEQAVVLEPDDHGAWATLIESYDGVCGDEWWDNHFELIEFCKAFLRTHPGNFRCLYALIENLLADKRFDEAAPYVEQIAQIPGCAHQAEVYRGDILKGNGDPEGAMVCWNRAVEEHPDVWQARCDRADGLCGSADR